MLGAVVANFMGKELKDDPVFQERLAKGQVNMKASSDEQKEIPPEAKRSVLIFGICLFCVVFYAMAISSTFALIKKPILTRDDAIISFMLGAATLICLFCKVDAKNILNAATFKSGMSACICVLGVAWLGTTFVTAHIKEINVLAANLLTSYPWMLAVVLFFAAMLLYSQAATTKALMPAALALGVSPVAAIAAFAAVSALFVLPTYPSLIAAVEFDDTGSTRVGKYVFDHPFLIPGTCNDYLCRCPGVSVRWHIPVTQPGNTGLMHISRKWRIEMTLLETLMNNAATATGISKSDLLSVFGKGERKSYAPGEYLFHESSPRLWAGIVEEGEVSDRPRPARLDHPPLHSGHGRHDRRRCSSGRNTPFHQCLHPQRSNRLAGSSGRSGKPCQQSHPDIFYRIVARVAQRQTERLRYAAEQLAGRPGRMRCLPLCAVSMTCWVTAMCRFRHITVSRPCAAWRTSLSPACR